MFTLRSVHLKRQVDMFFGVSELVDGQTALIAPNELQCCEVNHTVLQSGIEKGVQRT